MLHDITMLFTYFAPFICYEDDILEVISNLHIQGTNFGGKKDQFGRISFKKLNSTEFPEIFIQILDNIFLVLNFLNC